MDTTRDLPEVLGRLREADPAEAPDLADEVATRLARLLEEEDLGAHGSAPPDGSSESGPGPLVRRTVAVKEGESD